MTSLGQLLIETGLVSAEQVDEALRRQEQLGGRLGTCLLEIGALDERQLDTILTDQLGMPTARVEDLREIPEEIHSLLPANLAISCEAVPFRVRDDQVDVAILEIKNRGLHDELAFVIGKWIHVHIANEARIFEALQTYYGKDCTPRYRTLLERLDRERERPAASEPAPPSSAPSAGGEEARAAELSEAARSDPSSSQLPAADPEVELGAIESSEVPAEPPAPVIDDLLDVPFPDLAPKPSPPSEPTSSEDLRGPKLVYPPSPMRQRSIELTDDERAALERRSAPAETRVQPEAPLDGQTAQDSEAAAGRSTTEPPESEETVELAPKATVEQHPSAPWKAESADQIGQNLLRELGRQFRRVALYRVGRDGVRGWMGKGEGFDSARFASYRAELAQGSVFDSLASGGHLYLGRLTRSVAHDELLAAIGASPNNECMLTAISVGGRVVALTYGDRGSEGLDQTDLGAAQQLASRAGEAMRDLILRRKRKQA